MFLKSASRRKLYKLDKLWHKRCSSDRNTCGTISSILINNDNCGIMCAHDWTTLFQWHIHYLNVLASTYPWLICCAQPTPAEADTLQMYEHITLLILMTYTHKWSLKCPSMWFLNLLLTSWISFVRLEATSSTYPLTAIVSFGVKTWISSRWEDTVSSRLESRGWKKFHKRGKTKYNLSSWPPKN